MPLLLYPRLRGRRKKLKGLNYKVSAQTGGRLSLSVVIGLQRIGPGFLFPNLRCQVPDISGWVKADALPDINHILVGINKTRFRS